MEAKAKAEAERVLSEATSRSRRPGAVPSPAGRRTDRSGPGGGRRAARADQPTDCRRTRRCPARSRRADVHGPGAVPGHGRGGSGAAGPGPGRSGQAAEGSPRPDRAAPGRAERLTQTVDDARRSVEAIAQDLFAAEDNARVAAEDAGGWRPPDRTRERPRRWPAPAGRRGRGIRSEVAVEPFRARRGGRRRGRPPSPGRWRIGRPSDDPWPTAAPARDAGDRHRRGSTPGHRRGPHPRRRAFFARIRAEQSRRSAIGSPRDPRRSRRPMFPSRMQKLWRLTTRPPPRPDGDEDGASEDRPPDDRHPAAAQRDQMIEPIVSSLARRSSARCRTVRTTCSIPSGPTAPPGRPICFPPRSSRSTRWPPPPCPPWRRRRRPASPSPETGAGNDLGPICCWESPTNWPSQSSGPSVGGWTTRRALADADETAAIEHVGAAFREWKGERIERLAGDHVVAAFSTGTLAAVGLNRGSWSGWPWPVVVTRLVPIARTTG